MSARDKFHGLVKHDLENEGWTITHDPYTIDLYQFSIVVTNI